MASGSVIVLAEDDKRLRRLYVAALSVAGYNVLTAADGSEVLSLLSKVTPHLVILDIMMPKLNGIETCTRARKIIGDDIPIIFLSVLNSADILRDCLAAGGDDYLIKIGSVESVVERINSWCQHSRRQNLSTKREKLLLSVTAEHNSSDGHSPAAPPQMGGDQE